MKFVFLKKKLRKVVFFNVSLCVFRKKYLVFVRYKVVDDIRSQRVSSFFGLIFPFDRLGPTNTSIFFSFVADYWPNLKT